MAGTKNDVLVAKNADFTQVNAPNAQSSESNGLVTNGQLWIGSTAVNAGGTHVNVGSLTSPGGTVTIGYTSPNITLVAGSSVPTTFNGNTGSATPVANILNVVTANSTPTIVGSGSTLTLDFNKDNLSLGTSQGSITSATHNVGMGAGAFPALTSGSQNVCIGWQSGLLLNSGSTNTFVGSQSGTAVTSDQLNTGFGYSAFGGATGTRNVAVGSEAMLGSTGSNNVAVGDICFKNNPTGSENTAVGAACMEGQVTGEKNTAVGRGSAHALGGGSYTTYIGAFSGQTASGNYNACVGANTMGGATSTGTQNICVGTSAGYALTSGSDNCLFGFQCVVGLATGSSNIVIGSNAGSNYTTSESSNIVLSNAGTAAESNKMRLGTTGSGAGQVNQTFIAGITGVTVSNTQLVTINSSTGQMGVISLAGMVFTDTTATTLAVNNGYFATAAGTYNMPASAAQGDIIEIVCDTSGAVVLDCPASNFIRIGNTITSSGGTMTSTATGDALILRYRLSSLTWEAVSAIGTWTSA